MEFEMIRHMVFMNFRKDVSSETRDAIINDLGQLREEINGIVDFQHRSNISPEDHVTHGFKDMFWFDFQDQATRDVYLQNKNHQAVGARIVAAAADGLRGVFVCDVEI